ncbi:glycerate kinase [Aestuariimicrobium soli]|uniref:glycerate kinase n=1 Tax=Aestuariimicrobium soli TaxID=2035834 RepID=UPI003EB76F11
MRVVVAVDKFKGSLTGVEANEAVARGVLGVLPDAEVVQLPVADGGDGTLDAARAAGFTWNPVTCTGPTGEPVESGFCRRDVALGQGGAAGQGGAVAVVELADACGLLRLPAARGGGDAGDADGAGLPGMTASSRGLGEVMAAALDAGCTELVVGLGGSASTDGGAGLLQALGVRLTDESGAEVAPGVVGVAAVAGVDVTGLHPRLLNGAVRLVIASDVQHPLLGANGAAAVFGPQKGLAPSEVEVADRVLAGLADLVEPALGAPGSRAVPGAGAAGGVGWALVTLGGEVRRGIDVVLDWSSSDEWVAGAQVVITGEGSLDEQSLAGKAPIGVAELAGRHGVPVVAVSGRRLLTDEQVRSAGLAQAVALTDLEPSVERCIAEAGPLLEQATAQAVQTLLDQRRLG